MHQPPIKPFTPSPTVMLHPALQAVLDNLDIEIEEELSRYRRLRRNPGVPPKKPARPTRSVNAAALGILQSNIQMPVPRSSIYAESAKAVSSKPVSPQPPPQPQAYNSQAYNSQAYNSQVASPQPLRSPQPASVSNAVPSAVSSAAVSTVLPASAAATVTTASVLTDSLPPESTQIASYAEQHHLSDYELDANLQRLMHQPIESTEVPDDYLASSEELLRSIAEEETLRAEPDSDSLLNTLLTPLGIGSMLLLLLSSTALGYVMMNPSSLGFWTQRGAESASSNSTSKQTAKSGDAAPSPDLAAEEFVDLDLDTLSTLPKPNARSSPTKTEKTDKTDKTTKSNQSSQPSASSGDRSSAIASQADRSTSVESASIPIAPAPQPMSTVYVPDAPPVVAVPEPALAPEPQPVFADEPDPAPVALEPIQAAPPAPIAPEPEPIATAPIGAAASPDSSATDSSATDSKAQSAPSNYYYVVTEYSGDASLDAARDSVPDAYVRNLPTEGAKVQLGAFRDESKAEELLQELQNQGIEAEVYQP